MKYSFNLPVIKPIHCFTLIFTVMETVLHHAHTSAKEINKDRFSLCWPTHSAHVPGVSLCGFPTVALTGGSSAGVKERKQEVFAVCYQLYLLLTTARSQSSCHTTAAESGRVAHAGGAPSGLRETRGINQRKSGSDLGHIHFIIKGPELKREEMILGALDNKAREEEANAEVRHWLVGRVENEVNVEPHKGSGVCDGMWWLLWTMVGGT